MPKTSRTFLLLLISALYITNTLALDNFPKPPIAAYVDGINTWWGCNVPQALGLPTGSTTTRYNTVILSFWLSDNSAVDAVGVWANLPNYIPSNCGYGSDTQTMQKNLIKQFHSKGVNVIASAFGSTDYPTSEDPTTVCTSLAQFILANNLDGVDLDYEHTAAFNSQGQGESWLIQCTKTLRQYLPVGKYILTHAPQGPYFTTADLYPQGAYLKIDSQVGSLIDWYNLQYYNQGQNVYTTYEDLIVSCSEFPGTAVLQLKTTTRFGIAVAKPVTTSDASNGWVDPSTLVSWLQNAHNTAGWCGGAAYWQLISDSNGSFGQTIYSGLQGIGAACYGNSILAQSY